MQYVPHKVRDPTMWTPNFSYWRVHTIPIFDVRVSKLEGTVEQTRLWLVIAGQTTIYGRTPLNQPSIGAHVFLPMFEAPFEAFWMLFRILVNIQSVANILKLNICFNVWVFFQFVFTIRALKQHPSCFLPVLKPQNAIPTMSASEDLLFNESKVCICDAFKLICRL